MSLQTSAELLCIEIVLVHVFDVSDLDGWIFEEEVSRVFIMVVKSLFFVVTIKR